MLIKVCVILITFRVLLKFIPLDRLYSVIHIFLKKPVHAYTEYPIYTNRVLWAVGRTGHYLLRTKCLAQALTIHLLLNNKRIFNEIHIGFSGSAGGDSGHAWIEAGDRVLTGEGAGIQRYFKLFKLGQNG